MGYAKDSRRFFAKEVFDDEPVEYKTTEQLLHMSPADILQNVQEQQRR